jgi:hypothetical protein
VTARNPRSIVEQAIQKTRSHARRQLVIGLVGAAMMVVAWGPRPFVIVLLALNVVISAIVGRRLVRVRQNGPAVRALLDQPERIKQIASWPPKPPPNRMPVFLDIVTIDGATCSLLLDQKHAQSTADLLGALHSRSPDAVLSIPKLPVTTKLA